MTVFEERKRQVIGTRKRRSQVKNRGSFSVKKVTCFHCKLILANINDSTSKNWQLSEMSNIFPKWNVETFWKVFVIDLILRIQLTTKRVSSIIESLVHSQTFEPKTGFGCGLERVLPYILYTDVQTQNERGVCMDSGFLTRKIPYFWVQTSVRSTLNLFLSFYCYMRFNMSWYFYLFHAIQI